MNGVTIIPLTDDDCVYVKHWDIIVSLLDHICLDRSIVRGVRRMAVSALLSRPPRISKAVMLVNKFSLPGSDCFRSYLAEDLGGWDRKRTGRKGKGAWQRRVEKS